jgi:hypothetical protein
VSVAITWDADTEAVVRTAYGEMLTFHAPARV